LRFHATEVDGAYVVEIEPIEDERGFFARAWCAREFAENGLRGAFVQENIGFSGRAGTLRGLHFQRAPHAEVKLVRCTAGAVWDVAVDLREGSPTHRKWTGVELSAAGRTMLYVPEGCAHGYLTLTDDAETRYLTSEYYAPEAASGVRYDDPAFGIRWPADVEIASEADLGWPLLEPTDPGSEP
jgi:dTDP-4-dehydrorhamnose 3,5-epimerase